MGKIENMNNRQQLNNLKQEYLNMNIPEDGMEIMKRSIDRAKREKRRIARNRRVRAIGLSAAAVLVAAIVLPNTSAGIANAMGNIPVLGSFFKVVTFRDYHYEDDNYSAQADVPQITLLEEELADNGEHEAQFNDSVQKINLDIEKTTQELFDHFEEQVTQQEGHMSLDIGHEVVTDNDRWFTLKLWVTETQASGYMYYKFYTVDKQTGEIVVLSDLFQDGSDYVNVISEEIKRQMREQMAAGTGDYFLDTPDEPENESDFRHISAKENFYFNSNGDLVIIFDEYAVAPGYMGTPEFVIGKDMISGIMK